MCGGQACLQIGARADLCLIDPAEKWTIDSRTFRSMGHSTPFDGWQVQGRVVLTLKDGRPVWQAPGRNLSGENRQALETKMRTEIL